MSLRFHEIAEANHRILHPLSAEKLSLLGTFLDFDKNARVLDLACGKGEMLTQWARDYGIRGVGVDLSDVFIEAAKHNAYIHDVGDRVHFVVSDAAEYPQPHHEFDVVTCLGATWIGGGLLGTLDIMRQALKPSGGLLVVGEAYWRQTPTNEIARQLNLEADTFATLSETLARFEATGLDLIEMVLSDPQDFDRYEASQWRAVHQFLKENPTDRDAGALRQWVAKNRRVYMTHGREMIGWGVFVLNVPSSTAQPASVVDEESINPNVPVGFEVTSEMLWVRLADGRVIGNPITWYEWLRTAPQHQQENAELDAMGIAWPSLNGKIRIQDMLNGSY